MSFDSDEPNAAWIMEAQAIRDRGSAAEKLEFLQRVYENLAPRTQGYVSFSIADIDTEGLIPTRNPYPEGTTEHLQFAFGVLDALFDWQDEREKKGARDATPDRPDPTDPPDPGPSPAP